MPIAAIGLMLTVLTLMLLDGARAATSFNAQSAMGINLSDVSYYGTEQPFINCFATSEQWITHSDVTWDTHEEKYLNLDANGWPITLNSVNDPTTQHFSSLGVLFFLGVPKTATGTHPASQYVVLYDGQGTLSYGFDAALVRRSPGRDVINVTPSNKGIDLRIVATDPHHTGQYLRNIKSSNGGQ